MTHMPDEAAKLKVENKELQMLNAELENGILHLTKELEKEVRKNVGDKILLQYYTQMFSASAANWLLDPNPIELQCSGSKSGTTRNYVLQINDIVVIKSVGRQKDIFLKKNIRPLEGGPPFSTLHYNNNKVDWLGLLYLIQKRGEFIIRVQKSHAINIYDFTLQDDNSFLLNTELHLKVPKEFHEIGTDSVFDKVAYYKRLAEINYLYNTQLGFSLHYQKLKEITDYIKSLDVTTRTNEGQ